MKTIIKSTKKRIEEYADQEIHELKTTKWVAELIKASVIFVASVAFLFLIRSCSAGNYSGEKLNCYLQNNIGREIGSDVKIGEINYIYNGSISTLENSNAILTTGSYYAEDKCKYGRFIAIFESDKRTIWNDIVGTKAAYKLSFIRILDLSDTALESTFFFVDCKTNDLDDDGVTDFEIFFRSNFATRTSNSLVIISKYTGEWCVVPPDFSNIDEKVVEVFDAEHSTKLDVFELTSPSGSRQIDNVYGLAYDGEVILTEEPFWNIPCFLYKVPVADEMKGFMLTDEYVYVMEVYKEGRLFISANWNEGNVISSNKLNECSSDDEMFAEFDKYWGLQTETGAFFGESSFEPDLKS